MTPTPICDAYSNGCITPAPVPSPTLGVSTPPSNLPRTGPTGGDVVTLLVMAMVLLAVGILLAAAAKKRRT